MTGESSVEPGLLLIAVVIMALYSLVLGAYVLGMFIVAYREGRSQRGRARSEDYEAVLQSRFVIPVSVVAPIHNEGTTSIPAIRSLLALSYPTFEVVVVDDGSTDETLQVLIDAFALEQRQRFFRARLQAGAVRTVYRSRTEPRLTVVSKANGGKADAVNCGINFTRYRYLCCVDGDTVYDEASLLKAMALVAKDPAIIVGAASLFGISLEPAREAAVVRATPTTNRHLLGDFQHLDMMRSFVAYRAAWSRLDFMMCVSGAFGIWRRDVILEMGGFSPAFSCEDIEMTFRIHERFRREGRPYRIVSLPDMVAQTEGPRGVRALISQRARWQRVTLETVWHYRAMVGRPRYGTVGMIGLPYYLLFECLAPMMQLAGVLSLIAAAGLGLMEWPAYVAFLGIMVFGTAIPTTLAIWLHDVGFRDYRLADVARMIVLGPLDLLLYRPILMYAGLRGWWEFARGEKGWNKFERNLRAPSRV